MKDLIEKLEAAEAGSRELDGLIEDAISEWRNLGGWWREHKVTGVQEQYTYKESPHYTTSLDAALTLVPEGKTEIGHAALDFWCWAVAGHPSPKRSDGKTLKWCEARIWIGDGPLDDYDDSAFGVVVLSHTPALALCIAAIKARDNDS